MTTMAANWPGFATVQYLTAFPKHHTTAENMSENAQGHNSNEQLKAIVERIERLEQDKAEIASDIRDVYSEAKSNGFDVKALRQVVRMRKQDPADRAEMEALLETYMHALGMVA